MVEGARGTHDSNASFLLIFEVGILVFNGTVLYYRAIISLLSYPYYIRSDLYDRIPVHCILYYSLFPSSLYLGPRSPVSCFFYTNVIIFADNEMTSYLLKFHNRGRRLGSVRRAC